MSIQIKLLEYFIQEGLGCCRAGNSNVRGKSASVLTEFFDSLFCSVPSIGLREWCMPIWHRGWWLAWPQRALHAPSLPGCAMV